MAVAQHYKKTSSRSMMTGDWFEVKMAALIYLRSRARYNSGGLSHFKLATNVDETGAFDDIVYSVRLSDDDHHVTRTVLMQLKHKGRAHLGLDTFTSESGDFSLRKYLKSYVEIKSVKAMGGDSRNRFLLEGPFECFQFVIFTTAPLKKKDKILSKVTVVPEGYLENLLLTDVGQRLIYKFNRDEYENVISLAEGEEHMKNSADEFLQRLVIYTGQKMENELDVLIKKELISICSESIGNEESLYRILEGYFKKWWRDDKGEVLDETSDILQKALNTLSFETELIKQTKHCTLDVKFDEMIPDDIAEGISLLHVVSTGRSLRLTAAKVLQFLQTQQLAFTFISLEYLLLNSIFIFPDWEHGYKDYLIVMVDNAVTYERLSVKNISGIIRKILQENSSKKIVILSRKYCAITGNLIDSINNDFKTFHEKFDFSQLQVHSQEDIFNMKVLFKNEEMELQQLFDKESLKKLLIDDLVEDLLSKRSVRIDGRLPVVIPHFIPRRLRGEILERDIFKSNDEPSAVFTVSGLTVNELQQLVGNGDAVYDNRQGHYKDRHSSGGHEGTRRLRLPIGAAAAGRRVGLASDPADRADCRYLVLSKEAAQNEYELTVRVRHNVHWICVENNTLHLIRSSGSRTVIEKHKSDIILNEDAFSKQDNKVTIILGEPGMGKSTIIPKLAQTWKIKSPGDIIVEINLSEHLKLFAEQTGTFDFLVSSLGISSTQDKLYLKTSLEETGNVIVLVDSFDEVCPLYQNEACNLLLNLLKTKVKKIVITSRPCMEDVLKVHLVSSPYNLVEFSADEQREFFVKYFEQTSRPALIKEVVTKIMYSLQKIDPQGKLLGIPLQTFMIAEIFDDYLRDPENNEFPEHLDIVTLFEKFIDIKFKIYFSKNKDITWTQEELKANFVENHTYASFLTVFSELDIEGIDTSEKIVDRTKVFISRIKEGRDRSGLVSRVIDNKPIFIHQTFAEYLIALWLAKHHRSNRPFLVEHLFKTNSNVIRLMFNRILAKGHVLHQAILNQDRAEIEMLLSKEGVDVRSRDEGGRTAVHLAAASGLNPKECTVYKSWAYVIVDTRFIGPRERHTIELLLEHGATIDERDDVFKWTPLEYAIKTKTWGAGEYLLARGAGRNVLNESLKIGCDIKQINLCFVHEFKNIVNLLLDNGLIPNTQIGFDTMLQIACLVGNIDIVDALLTKIETGTRNMLSCFWFNRAPVRRSIHSANKVGDSAISLACECKHADVVQLLLSRGADVFSRNLQGNTSLHFASLGGALRVVYVLVAEAERRRPASVREFVNTPNEFGKTSLGFACRYQHRDVAVELVRRGADVSAVNELGDSCLHVSCLGGDVSVVRLVLDHLGEVGYTVEEAVNAVNKTGETPLAHACLMGHVEVIHLLAAHGADMFVVDRLGNTCLHHACYGGEAAVVEAIFHVVRKRGQSVVAMINVLNTTWNDSALSRACRYQHHDIVKLLLATDADIYAKNDQGNNCLHYACQACDASLVIALMQCVRQRGESVTNFINTANGNGETPLILACKYQNYHIARALIANDADVFECDDHARSCLHYACSNGATSLAAMIVENAARVGAASVEEFVNAVNSKGETSLMFACHFGRWETATWLLARGASIRARDLHGNSCLHHAFAWNDASPGKVSLVKAILDGVGDKQNAMALIEALNESGDSPMSYAVKSKHAVLIGCPYAIMFQPTNTYF